MTPVPPPTPKVVIVGAGFGGLSAARALARSGAQVTIVDRNIYSTFQPLLYQVATGGLNPSDVSYPVRSFARSKSLRYRRGTVHRIDVAGRHVFLDGGALAYDYLVLASGTIANFYGVPGAAEHSFLLYRRTEAVALRDQLMGRMEQLAEGKAKELSIVVAGGGPTGVELAGTLAELRDEGLQAVFPEIDPTTVRVVLVEQGPELLAPFRQELRRYTLAQLQRRGVEVRASTSITSVDAGSVTLAGGTTIRSDLTVWAAGVSVPDWGLPRGQGGRVLVGSDLRVQGLEEVFVVGDACLPAEEPIPQLAQPALQTGRHAGEQICRLIAGQPTAAFHYRDKGTMATIGRRAAVVQLPHGIKLTGTIAWLAWLALHIFSLLGNRNRISTLLNLSWRYLAWPEASVVIVGDVPEAESS